MIWWKQNSDNFLQCFSDLQSTVEPLLWDISIKGHRLHSGYIKSGLTKCSHNNNFVYVTPKQRQKKIKSFTKHGKTLWLVIAVCFRFHLLYHKILKISPREYTFQRPFLRGLYTERNGALQNWLGLYTWRKICGSELTGLAYSWKKLYVRNCYWKTSWGGRLFLKLSHATENKTTNCFTENAIHQKDFGCRMEE